jgi:hypothetical protein
MLANRKVLVRDPESGQKVSMPASELAPGMVRALDRSTGEEIWLPASQLELPAELRHPPFGPEMRDKVKQLSDGLQEVCPRTPEEWEVMLRMEAHPNKELEVWLHILRCYQHFTAGRPLSQEQKSDISRVICHATLNGCHDLTRTLNCLTISKRRMREVAAYVQATWKGSPR